MSLTRGGRTGGGRGIEPLLAAQKHCRAVGRPFPTWGTPVSEVGFYPDGHCRGNSKNTPRGKCYYVVLGKGSWTQFVLKMARGRAASQGVPGSLPLSALSDRIFFGQFYFRKYSSF